MDNHCVTIQEIIIDTVLSERERQDDKWGEQNHDNAWWLVILVEEVGEAAEALLRGDDLDYRKELIQVAAVAIAAVECADRAALKMEK